MAYLKETSMLKHFSQLILLLLFMSAASYQAGAQIVSGVQATIVGTSIKINYSVSSTRPNQKYRVRLFSSLDQFTAPLTEGVTGDLGDDISLSASNSITIADPISTLGPIAGDVSFKVRADLIYNPVTINKPISFFAAKRGKNVEVRWEGGLKNEIISFNLYRNLNLVQEDLHTTNNYGSTFIKIPKKLELGEGYSMQMEVPSLDAPLDLPDFQVKRKQPIAVRVITLVAVLVAAYIVWAAAVDGGGLLVGPLIFPEDTTLPEPPAVPGFTISF
jgi:hypothetical protein